jgi:hypothetical protein
LRVIFLRFLVTVASCEAAFAENNSINELRQMFDYDQKLPLDVKEVGFRDVDGVRIHDINMRVPSLDVLPLISLSLLLKASMRASYLVIGDPGTAQSFFLKRYCTQKQVWSHC